MEVLRPPDAGVSDLSPHHDYQASHGGKPPILARRVACAGRAFAARGLCPEILELGLAFIPGRRVGARLPSQQSKHG